MTGFVLALLLLVLSLLGVILRKIYYYLPAKELKRQAENGDKLARTLWRAVSYGASLRVLLWLWIGLSAAGGFVLLARLAPPWIAFAATALLLLLAFAWFPRRTKLTGMEAQFSMWLTPGVARVLSFIHPVLERTLNHIPRRYSHEPHTDLYETADLLEFVERQGNQPDNRIPTRQLQAVQKALTAHQYKVSDVLTPPTGVKSVSDSDTVSLVLMDDLHKSGQTIFPVRKGKTDRIIGALYLQDIGLNTEGKVRDYMTNEVRYLHEDDSLHQALQAFYKTKQQLFVVVNSFEEYAGVITLEHVMKQLSGDIQTDSFTEHHDLAAVANKHAHDDEEPEPEEEPLETAGSEPEDPDFDEISEVDDAPVTDPEPESEIVTEESEAPEESEATEEQEEIETPEPADVPEETESEPEKESVETEDTEDLAALDLPDEDEESELGEGSHVTFEKPNKTNKKK